MAFRKKKVVLTVISVLVGIAIGLALFFYLWIFNPNVKQTNSEKYLYIPTGANFKNVTDSLATRGFLENMRSFKWVAKRMSYPDNINPGRYLLKNGMNNRELLNKLRSGKQDAVKLTFHYLRTKKEFAAHISHFLEVDSLNFLSLLNDSTFVNKHGFTPETVYTMFIPNTYQVYWNTHEKAFFERMFSEYQRFWNENRKQKAKEIGLSPIEVSILASIVIKESNKTDEMPTIAGVYMNRLNRGQKLQADPTVIFALGNFGIRRVLNKYLSFQSPYNTYVHTGLPPGPISMPSIKAIDAVLNYERHDYIYFCAKADFSGYHAFASNYSDHLRNARAFQKALNEQDIKH